MTVALVAGAVLVVGLRAEPAPSGVTPGEPGGVASSTAAAAPLPVLRACIDAPPPCTVTSGEPDTSGGPTARGPVLREDEFRLRAYDPDGTTLWSVSLTGDAATSRGPDGGVVVAEPGGRVRLLDGRSGVVRWEVSLPFAPDWAIGVTGDDETVAVTAAPPTVDDAPRVIRVVGLDPGSGTVLWVHLANTRAPQLTAEATDDVILLTGVLGDGVVSAIDTASGLLRWQAELGSPLMVLAQDGRVLAAGADRLAILDAATGSRELDVRVPSGVTDLLSVSETGAIIRTAGGPVTVALPDAG